MAIGLNINKDVRVELGEIKEILLNELESASVKYEIPFDKTNKDGVKETIITMREPDIEISLSNDLVTYIKSDNTEFSNLDKVEDANVNVASHISKIKERINDKFNTDGCNVKIEKLDSKTLNITLIVSSKNDKCRVQIIRDTFGDIYINTIMAL